MKGWHEWYGISRGVEKYLVREGDVGSRAVESIEVPSDYLKIRERETEGLRKDLHRSRERGRAQQVELDRVKNRMKEHRANVRSYRAVLRDFRALVASPESTETKVHQFMQTEAPSWLFGLEYATMKSKVRFPPGTRDNEFDFMLGRYDGFWDLVELKGPNERLFTRRGKNRYTLSRKLSEALGQSMTYLHACDKAEASNIFKPRAIVVIGSQTTDDPRQRRMLVSHLARLDVLTYSDLVARGEKLLKHLEGKGRRRKKAKRAAEHRRKSVKTT